MSSSILVELRKEFVKWWSRTAGRISERSQLMESFSSPTAWLEWKQNTCCSPWNNAIISSLQTCARALRWNFPRCRSVHFGFTSNFWWFISMRLKRSFFLRLYARYFWLGSSVSRDRVEYSSDCLACLYTALEGTAEGDSGYFGELRLKKKLTSLLLSHIRLSITIYTYRVCVIWPWNKSHPNERGMIP